MASTLILHAPLVDVFLNIFFSSWMQNRAAPPHLGMKELPQGAPWCLWGKVFMCTGVLDSLERDDAFKLIEHYGGKIAKSVTKQLTHAVVGTDAGAKKLEQIEVRDER